MHISLQYFVLVAGGFLDSIFPRTYALTAFVKYGQHAEF
jgi:hypothetical protein